MITSGIMCYLCNICPSAAYYLAPALGQSSLKMKWRSLTFGARKFGERDDTRIVRHVYDSFFFRILMKKDLNVGISYLFSNVSLSRGLRGQAMDKRGQGTGCLGCWKARIFTNPSVFKHLAIQRTIWDTWTLGTGHRNTARSAVGTNLSAAFFQYDRY